MRRLAWWTVAIYVFTIPWEYSLDLGPPWGHVARLAGLLALLAAVSALVERGGARWLGTMQTIALLFFIWLALSCLWSLDAANSFAKLRGYAQEMMILYLVWEFAEDAEDLRGLLWAYEAGCWALALLSFADFATAGPLALQIRFTAAGQDPNDAARYAVLGLPLAVLLFDVETNRWTRTLAIAYLPASAAAIVLSGSRSGLVVACIALFGCGQLLMRTRRRVLALCVAAPAVVGAIWLLAPRATLWRLASVYQQLHGGDLNKRLNIWRSGWLAFARAPLCGHGAGSFVYAAGTAPADTAHNTLLSIAVSAGVVGVLLASLLALLAVTMAWRIRDPLRTVLLSMLAVWLVAAQNATVEENRSSWLLLSIVALAWRLAEEERAALPRAFGWRRADAPRLSESG